MGTGGQLEIFRIADDDARLITLKAYLRDRGWVLARDIAQDLRFNDRDCRALAEASEGAILSGQKGYKLTAQATPEEIAHSTNAWESQGKRMISRALQTRNYYHRAAHRGLTRSAT